MNLKTGDFVKILKNGEFFKIVQIKKYLRRLYRNQSRLV